MIDQIIQDDCLNVLRLMPNDSVDLVYLDPPFFSQKQHSLRSKDLTEYAFNDQWESVQDYIGYLQLRVKELKRVMKNTASLFFHCDRHASHHIRLLLDDVFGAECFVSEIIWAYKRWSNNSARLLPAHQTIFMYSKTQHYTFNTLFQPYSETTNLDQILQKRRRDANGKTIYETDVSGQVLLNGPKQGVPLSDVWEIPYLNPKAAERTGYPTQKPILLLERIILLASNEGDLVLDPFCGSGTTLVAAQLLKRSHLGIDYSEAAVNLARSRLEEPIKTESHLMQSGRENYENLPEAVKDILRSLRVKLVQRNSGIDALHDDYIDGKPIVIRVQRPHETLLEAGSRLEKAAKRKQAALMILIRTKKQRSLFDSDEEYELLKGIIVLDALDLSLQNVVEGANHTLSQE